MTRPIAHSLTEVRACEAPNVVLALLDSEDFPAAQALFSDLLAWRDNEDFVQERESAYFGYGTAGVSACLQVVSLAGFERWITLTGAPSDLASLDLFAAHWLWRTQNPNSPIVGIQCRHSSGEAGYVGQDGLQRVAIFPDGFERWRNTLARLPLFADKSPTLNAYAGFVVETCIGEALAIEPI